MFWWVSRDVYLMTSRQNGGTLCFTRKWWQAPKFPQHMMRDSVSTRPGLLLHTKALLARPVGVASGPVWAYVGSSNMSESAW
jgi:hypothetical protein